MSAPSNKALHLTLCCSLGLLPQDRRSHESAAESGRYAAQSEPSGYLRDV